MKTTRIAAALLVVACIAGCANNSDTSPPSASASGIPPLRPVVDKYVDESNAATTVPALRRVIERYATTECGAAVIAMVEGLIGSDGPVESDGITTVKSVSQNGKTGVVHLIEGGDPKTRHWQYTPKGGWRFNCRGVFDNDGDSALSDSDVKFLKKNIATVAGNVVTTVNNAREVGFDDESAMNGGVYDVASLYDDMTSECKTRTTRSIFRQQFIDRIVPVIDHVQPERVTVDVDRTDRTAVAKVEQQSGRTLVMRFAVDGTAEDFLCTNDGLIAISTGGGATSPPSPPRPPATTKSPDFPAEWDKNGDGLIDKDAPIG